MNRGWYHHSMAHKLASKGIKTKSPFKGAFANGLVQVEAVWWDDLPDYLYHATPTENVEKILKGGIKLGEEEMRTIEEDIEAEEGLIRPVEDTIFFTEYPEQTGYFGVQAVQSLVKRKGEKFKREDMDYTILKIDTEEFRKSNFYTYLGAELFGTGEREYFVRYKVPRFWITAGQRIYYDKERDEIREDTYTVYWDGVNYEIVGHWGGF